MGKAQVPASVKLVVGMITKDVKFFEKVSTILSSEFGVIDYKSPILDFDFTDYYEKEMGKGLKRQFVSFRDLITPERLPEIKLFTRSSHRFCGEHYR